MTDQAPTRHEISFRVWLIKNDTDFARGHTMPRLPMIFETEDTAKAKIEMIGLPGLTPVLGTLTFREDDEQLIGHISSIDIKPDEDTSPDKR